MQLVAHGAQDVNFTGNPETRCRFPTEGGFREWIASVHIYPLTNFLS